MEESPSKTSQVSLNGGGGGGCGGSSVGGGDFDEAEQASTASLRSATGTVELPEDDVEEEEEDKPIDDDEFNIPPVDFVPSLESILNDVDDVGSLCGDEDLLHGAFNQESGGGGVASGIVVDQMVILPNVLLNFTGSYICTM